MNRSAHFYYSLTLLICLNVIIKPLWIFGIDREVQNITGLSSYGAYFSLLSLSIICNFLLDWGVTTFLNQQLAARNPAAENSLGTLLWLKAGFTIVYSIVVVSIAYVSGITRWDLVTGLILLQVFTSAFLFFRAVITARQSFKIDAWLSVLDKTLMIIVCGTMILFPFIIGPVSINKFLWTQVICMFIAVLCALLVIMRNKWMNFQKPGKLHKGLFRSALPFAMIFLLMGLHYRLDSFLLERWHPEGSIQAGIYASSYRLLEAANMIGFLFSSFLLPYIAQLYASNQSMETVILRVRHLLITFSIIITTVTIFFGPWIYNILYTHSTPEAIDVVRWCIPAMIGYSLVHIYGTVLTATGKIYHFCLITAGAVLLNLAANLILIPTLGAKGCCISALISQLFCGIVTMIVVRQKMKISIHPGSIGIYIFIAALMSVIFYCGLRAGMDRILLLIVAIIISIIVILVTRLFNFQGWIRMLGRERPST